MPKPSYFIYIIRPSRPDMLTQGATTEEEAAIAQHSDYLENLTNQGIAILVGRTLNVDPTAFGMVIFQASSLQNARSIMKQDPAVQQGVMQAELYPFKLVFHHAID